MGTIFKKLLKKSRPSNFEFDRSVLITLLGIVLLVVAFIWLSPKQTATPSKDVVVSIIINNNKITSGPSVVKARQGDNITFKITTDQPNELHIHGYDNVIELEANKESSTSFEANLTGSFEYELEQSDTVIGQLEVLPR